MGSLSPRSTSLPPQRGCPISTLTLDSRTSHSLVHWPGHPLLLFQWWTRFVQHFHLTSNWVYIVKLDPERRWVEAHGFHGFVLVWLLKGYKVLMEGPWALLMTHSRSASSLKMNNSIFSLRSLTSKFFCVPDISKCTGHSFYAEPSFCKKLSH